MMHEMKFFNGVLESPEEAIERIDDIGGPNSHTNYPWGWAQCGNSPFRWYKQNTHAGGVHVPMIMHWPARLAEQAGTKRTQFVNVSDITPTIYDLLGIVPPDTYRGIAQMPVTGHSFAAARDDPGVMGFLSGRGGVTSGTATGDGASVLAVSPSIAGSPMTLPLAKYLLNSSHFA